MEAGPRENDDQAREPWDDEADPVGAPATSLPPGSPRADGPADAETTDQPDGTDGGELYGELRPPRRFRFWLLAPIVSLGALGSLMFAFPLAFDFEDGGALVAMLGLLLCCCAAGWGMMAARRAGLAWPGLPAPGSGERPDWRLVALYTLLLVALVVLSLWRVARLR